MSGCSHAHTNVSSKSGPARMATTQEGLRKLVANRFRTIRGAVRTTIVENDALRLSEDSGGRSPRDVVNQDVEAPDNFRFVTADDDNSDRVAAFRRWFNDAVDRGLVEPIPREEILSGRHFTAPHVDNGYTKGIRWANARSRDAGITVDDAEIAAIVRRPPHAESLRTLYTRTFENTQSVGEHSKETVNRMLAEGLEEGLNPRTIGDRLTAELRDIQHRRGRTLARTEVMNAFVEGNATRLEEFGVGHANIATFNPCPVCAAYRAAGPHTLNDVRDAIPLHPNCVCALIPASPSDDPLTEDYVPA